MGPQVPVVFDSADVVENESTIATVVITGDACERHDSAQNVL